MGFGEFIAKRFLNKEVCISLNNGETETITISQVWQQNREHFQGIVKEVVDGIIVLDVSEGLIYINSDSIDYIWELPLQPHKIMKMAYSKKIGMAG